MEKGRRNSVPATLSCFSSVSELLQNRSAFDFDALQTHLEFFDVW
jgi:hypothetical protein